MGAHDKLTIVKDMTYRGVKEEWCNTYELNGTTPANETAWKALADAIIASEKACYTTSVRVIRALGYASGSDNAAFSYDYLAAGATVAGTLVDAVGQQNWAGDQAAWLRMRVGASAGGKPIYVRKYFHGGYSPQGSPDSLTSGTRTAYTTHAAKMVDGTLPGSMKWIGPNGTVGYNAAASTFTTTRTLKRRGRRPTPAP